MDGKTTLLIPITQINKNHYIQLNSILQKQDTNQHIHTSKTKKHSNSRKHNITTIGNTIVY